MMKIEKKTFYSFNDDNGEGFKKLQEFSKTIKKENFIKLDKGTNGYLGITEYTVFYWTDEE